MEKYREIFAERLKYLRDEKNITLAELAEYLGIGISTLSQYENCDREPRFSNMLKICRYFNESIDWIIGDTDERGVKARKR